MIAIETRGGPAFPSRFEDTHYFGISARDYFAAQALQGILSGPAFNVFRENGNPCATFGEAREEISRRAYAYADAMIAERDK